MCSRARCLCRESQVGLCGSMWRAAVPSPCSTHGSEWLCHHISAQRLGTAQASGFPSSHSPSSVTNAHHAHFCPCRYY